ncbi:hypothetical protein CC79DRAFT_1389499 [Sarocladium strictum]
MSIPARRPVGAGPRQSYSQGRDWRDDVSSISSDEDMRPVQAFPLSDRVPRSEAERDSQTPTRSNPGPYKSVSQIETWADEPSLKEQPDNAFRPPRNSSALQEEVQTPKNPVTFYVIAADAASILLPLALLGFLIVVILLDGKETSNGSFAKWENAITVLATIFPIIFASIVGRLTYEAARWKLERGASVGSLEQLLGSRTFGGTILTQFSLGSINFLSISLVLLWAFSPLGGQSILRILSSDFAQVQSFASVVYQNTELGQGLADVGTARGTGNNILRQEVLLQFLGNRLATLLLSPESIQQGHQDLWGNFKIPFHDEIKHKDAGQDGWRSIGSGLKREDYTSLTGIPVAQLPAGNVTFAIESSYLYLQCDNMTTRQDTDFQTSDPGNFFHKDLIKQEWPSNDSSSSSFLSYELKNGSWHGISMFDRKESESRWSLAIDRFVDPYWVDEEGLYNRTGYDDPYDNSQERADALKSQRPYLYSPALLKNETDIDVGLTRLIYESETGHDYPWGHTSVRTLITCDARQRYIESEVRCLHSGPSTGGGDKRHDCSVTRQRTSRQKHASENILHLSFPNVFWRFTRDIPVLTHTGRSGRWDMLNAYIRDPNAMGPSRGGDEFAESNPESKWEHKDKKAISRRLAQVLNTYLLLSSIEVQGSSNGEDGSLDGNRDDSGGGVKERDAISNAISPNSTASAEVSNLVLRYQVSRLWATLGLLSCAAFLIGGIASVVFAHLSEGPEVLGYVSTVMRDSKILDLHPRVGYMGAMDISRMHKSLRVRYGYDEALSGSPVVGVGRETDVTSIRKKATK